ncbi:hypothetical protein KEM56_005931 [Ascosphaera pollenicola]|nr:hypothetical protein KEM56_005931 [Ascosphaera pollenicola]
MPRAISRNAAIIARITAASEPFIERMALIPLGVVFSALPPDSRVPDALNRHKAVHRAAPKAGSFRSLRACMTCATARVKCSGSMPCDRCSTKLINCVFASRMRDSRQLSQANRSACESGTGTSQQISQQQQQQEQQQQHAVLDQANVSVCGASAPDMSAPMVLPENFFAGDMSQAQETPAQFVDDIPAHLQLLTPNLPNLTSQVGISHSQRLGPGGFPPAPDAYFEPSFISSLNWLSSQFPFGPEFAKPYDQQPATAFPMIETPPGMPNVPYPTSSTDHQSPQQSETTVSYTTRDGISGIPRLANEVHKPEVDETQGGFYVEGNGARLPRNGRRKKSNTSAAEGFQFEVLAGLKSAQMPMAYGFHETPLDSLEQPATEELVHDAVYREICDLFERTCVSSPIFPPFAAATFPSIRALNHMVSSHLSSFNTVFPIFHPSDINTSSRLVPLLFISMAAVGSHYIEVKNAALLSLAMHEFVRRCLVLENSCQVHEIDDWYLVYAKIMNCIGLHYSIYRDNRKSPRSTHTELLVHFHQLNAQLKAAHGPVSDIVVWRRREIQIRLTALIWLLDTMIGSHFGIPPLIQWNTDILLPCEESLWEGLHVQVKYGMMENMTLQNTLQILYMEKRLPAQAGEFAKICIIHGLYRTLGHIAYTLRFPLHSWSPTSERIDCSSLHTEEHHHRIPVYQKWRNASCDVIDVLHWRAVSIIAATGTENPTVHHLHFARIILLTPYEDLMRLAIAMAQGNTSDECIEASRFKIQLWATEDQFKARLAMVHAGVGFWHARRYSTGAFYEATNMFLTTLAVWAYSSYINHPKKCGGEAGLEDEGTDLSECSDDDSTVPTFIQLDRPTDDELVQFYVRRGSDMTALISGIGNIHGPEAPIRTLKEGRKMLLQMANWGICTRFIWVLSRLIDDSEETRGQGPTTSEQNAMI